MKTSKCQKEGHNNTYTNYCNNTKSFVCPFCVVQCCNEHHKIVDLKDYVQNTARVAIEKKIQKHITNKQSTDTLSGILTEIINRKLEQIEILRALIHILSEVNDTDSAMVKLKETIDNALASVKFEDLADVAVAFAKKESEEVDGYNWAASGAIANCENIKEELKKEDESLLKIKKYVEELQSVKWW